MKYARAMPSPVSPPTTPSNTVGWACIFALSVIYALAISHGVVTIDVARDLYWGQRIVHGDALPLLGPPVGSTTLLSPVWYYIVAAVLSISTSLTAYFALMGLLAASKFLLAYVVGRRWLGSAFGLSLAVASAVPGVASYQMLGIGHPWFVEMTLWLAAWYALRLGAESFRLRWAVGLGAAAALAMHAHPTAIVLLPWALVALAQLPVHARLRALAASGIAALLVFSPWLLAKLWPTLAANSGADNVIGPSGIGGSVLGVTGIAQNLLWAQAKNIFDSLLPHALWGTGFAMAAWSGVLVATVIGMVMAWREQRLRGSLIGALLSLIWAVVALALLRDHTPFYMAFVALLPLAALLAVAWVGLLGGAGLGRALWIAVLLTVIGLHALCAAGLVHIARQGWVDSYLPLHSNMQDTSTAVHRESVLAVPTRDALARWLCVQPAPVSLHGDIGAGFDMGLHHETDLKCPSEHRQDNSGGAQRAWVGLPLAAWKQAGVHAAHELGAYGLVPAERVLLPATALAAVSGQRYPPRFDLMLAAARQPAWSTTAMLPVSSTLIVSNLLPTSPLFTVEARADGVLQAALVTLANTAIFRCDRCAGLEVQWSVQVRGGLPQAVSMTSVDVRQQAILQRTTLR